MRETLGLYHHFDQFYRNDMHIIVLFSSFFFFSFFSIFSGSFRYFVNVLRRTQEYLSFTVVATTTAAVEDTRFLGETKHYLRTDVIGEKSTMRLT